MKIRMMLAAIALCIAGAATAGGERVDVAAVARESGLSERQVRMVLGTPSGFAEYRTSYRHAERRLQATYGAARAAELAALYRQRATRLAMQ